MPEDFVDIIDRAAARRYGADQAAALAQALAGQHAIFKRTADSAILSVEETDFSCANTDIARGHVQIRVDVAKEFRYKCLAESHDLSLVLST